MSSGNRFYNANTAEELLQALVIRIIGFVKQGKTNAQVDDLTAEAYERLQQILALPPNKPGDPHPLDRRKHIPSAGADVTPHPTPEAEMIRLTREAHRK